MDVPSSRQMAAIYNLLERYRLEHNYKIFLDIGVTDERDFIDRGTDEDLEKWGQSPLAACGPGGPERHGRRGSGAGQLQASLTTPKAVGRSRPGLANHLPSFRTFLADVRSVSRGRL
ncbi:unnamed protein product [Lota lota]